jgi:hypothetical protein
MQSAEILWNKHKFYLAKIITNIHTYLIMKILLFRASDYLSGVFNVMLIVLSRLMNRNRIFIKEKTIEQRRESYDNAANPVEAFLEDAVADDSVECDVVTK